MIDVVLSTIIYISPHICKVLLLIKQGKATTICVLTIMHDLMWEFPYPMMELQHCTNNEKFMGLTMFVPLNHFLSSFCYALDFVCYKYQHGINKDWKFDVDCCFVTHHYTFSVVAR
jgi:hypothetical protein